MSVKEITKDFTSQVPIFILDDHPLVRSAIRAILKDTHPKSNIVESDSSKILFKHLLSFPDSILIIDLRLQEAETGMDVIKKVKSDFPKAKIVVYTGVTQSLEIVEALRNGADMILSKLESPESLKKIFTSSQVKTGYVSPQIEKIYNPEVGNNKYFNLTKREVEVLRYIANGHKDKEIASALEISRHTVTFHKQNLKEKLMAESTAEMIRFAYENNLA